jgi:hypothetical protein
MTNLATKSEFAKIINKKPSYVTELGKYGRLVFDEISKKILVAESLALIESSKDLSKAGVVARHEAEREEKKQVENSIFSENELLDNSTQIVEGSYHDYKTQNERYKALKAKQEYETSMKLLLTADDVIKAVSNAASIIRTRFEAQPDILAEQLAAESDPARCKSMMIDYNENFLTELSQLFKKLGGV